MAVPMADEPVFANSAESAMTMQKESIMPMVDRSQRGRRPRLSTERAAQTDKPTALVQRYATECDISAPTVPELQTDIDSRCLDGLCDADRREDGSEVAILVRSWLSAVCKL